MILAFIIGFQVTGQPRRHFTGVSVTDPKHGIDGRPQVNHGADQGGPWITGKAEKRNVRHMAEQKRLSRTHGHTPEIHLQAALAQCVAHDVVVAHGNAAAGDQKIAVLGARGQHRQRLFVVWSDPQVYRLAAAGSYKGCQSGAVGAWNLIGSGRLPWWDQLVPGG